MKKKNEPKIWIATMILTALMATSVFAVLAIGIVSATTWYVEEGESIQAAVDAANNGDSIIVRDGTYTENVDVNVDNLTIQSENGSDSTIVQAADYNDHVFEVQANYVNINGFTVKGALLKTGIYFNNINNCDILNNIALNNKYGIYLRYSSNNNLTNNKMSGNNYNFYVYGYSLSNYIQNIDTTNKVDGKPIYYWIDEQNKQIPSNAGYVGVVNSTNITVRDLTVTNSGQGVLFAYTENSTIENVTISYCSSGIYLHFSNKNNVTNNNVLWTGNGIYFSDSSENLISNNSVSKGANGLYLGGSSSNILMGNNMSGNLFNFGVDGSSFDHFSQIIDTTNLVNGKPIYYLINKHNIVVNSFSNAGYVGIINSSNVTVKDLTLTWNIQGVLFAYVDNSRIENVNATNNRDGISLRDSSNNIIKNNIASNNCWDGILLDDSSNNSIYHNNFISNMHNVESRDSTNIWNSTSKITYTYNGNTYTNYLGNYWSDYTGSDADKDGIGDTPYSIDGDNDNYPLVEPWENYFKPTPVYGKGIWISYIWDVEDGDLDKIISKLKFANVTWVMIKCGDSDSYWLEEGKKLYDWAKKYGGFDKVIEQFHNNGINVLGAHWVESYDKHNIPAISEIDVSNKILNIEGIDGLLIDAENDTEAGVENYRGYIKSIREMHKDAFIGYTGYARADGNREKIHELFSEYCDAVMPQAYWQHRPTTPDEEIEMMEEHIGKLRDKWNKKLIIPMGQGYYYDHASEEEVKISDETAEEMAKGISEFCKILEDKGYLGVSLFRYDTMHWKTWQAYAKCFIPITITAYSPVDIVVTDPDNLTISKQANEISGATYTEVDINGDGDLDDKIIIPYRKIGNYLISVVPEPDALPTDTYTLEVSVEDTTITLAEDVQISDIRDQPYMIRSTEEGIIQIIPAMIDFDPDVLNLQSEGKWVTTYIELPEGYDASNITVSTVMLNDQVQAEMKPTEIGDYDDDGIADLMVKFDWSAVQEILEVGDEVEITVTGELTDGTPFGGSDMIRVIDQS